MLPPKYTYDMFNHIQKYGKQIVIQDPFTSAETKKIQMKWQKWKAHLQPLGQFTDEWL